MKGKTIRKICNALLHVFERSKKLFHKRGKWMSRHVLMRALNGSIMSLLGFLLALPLPIPFTNTLPALAIATLCLGSLKEDGLVIALGWVISMLALTYFCIFLILPATHLIILK